MLCCTSCAEAEQLIELAEKMGLVLMVDHTFVYTGAVRKIKEIISTNRLGDLYYFDSVRVNLGLFRHDINVLWDLASHDVSIMQYIIERRALAVSAIGACHAGSTLENIAYLTVFFDDPLIAHIHANWLAPVKIRKTLICGSKKMIVYDDTEPSEKVKVYDKAVTIDATPEEIYKTLVTYRTGDMYSPKLDQTEALKVECEHFIDCIQNKTKPITDGEAGLQVVKILEAAQKSMETGGGKVKLG
jgi:predicted dehydrogenase